MPSSSLSPPSPIEELADLLNARQELNGFAKVLAGKNYLAAGRAPPSIVLYPFTGAYKTAEDILGAFLDVDMLVVARLWGNTLGEAWSLRARLIAALWGQAQGDPANPSDAAAGFFYKLFDETWDIEPSTDDQGDELEVVFAVRLSASDKTLKYGEVDAVGITRTTTLAAPMLATDVVANADTTAGNYPSSGYLELEGEIISYSGLTASSFTGLVRGLRSTVAAPHGSGAVVNVTTA